MNVKIFNDRDECKDVNDEDDECKDVNDKDNRFHTLFQHWPQRIEKGWCRCEIKMSR